MDNRKPLVIIPPYTQPLKKLEEILTSPEETEPPEIYVVDDLKEVAQLIPTLGQCLIVITSAKKCALFLQESRWAIMKNHSKVILIQPKEIPQKTLMKFVKIGLTEVILESLPPKSLLYKIKLLLRSVKGVKSEKEENINVKSMLDINNSKDEKEEQRVEKGVLSDQEVLSEDQNEEKKQDEEINTDALGFLKSRKKASEENVIDTHWKTMKKTNELTLDMGEQNNDKDKNDSDLSTYYKTDRNKNLDQDIIPSDNMFGKSSIGREEHNEFSVEKLKRSEEITLDLEKAKRNKETLYEQEETGDQHHTNLNESKALELEKPESEKERQLENFLEKKRKEREEAKLGLEEKKKQEQINQLNQIDAYFKGKTAKIEILMETDDENTVDPKDEINLEIEEEEKNKIEVIDLTSEGSRSKKQSEEIQVKENLEKEKSLMNDNDIQDEFMRGKVATNLLDLVDGNLKDTKDQADEKKDQENFTPHKLAENDNEAEDIKKEMIFQSIDQEKQAEEDQEDIFEHNDTLKKERKQETEIQFEKEEDFSENSEETNDLDKFNKLQRLLIDEKNDNNSIERNSKNDIENRNAELKKLKNTNMQLESGDENKVSEGQVEHIDTYMRSGESKTSDHDWNLPQKKKDIDLVISRSEKEAIEINNKKKFKDAGEITIDYRKLKEEFEMLKEGAGLSPDELETLRKNIRGEDIDDSSIRVFVPAPKGLDFAIDVAFDLLEFGIKPRDIFEKISRKIHSQGGLATFLIYSKPTAIKEAYSAFDITELHFIKEEVRNIWIEKKKENDFFKNQTNYSLSTWRCHSIKDKSGKPWEETELPTWAQNELTDKEVDYIYPMYDGLDRMGHIYVWFPNGIIVNEAKNIDILIESSRSLFLDQIVRSSKKVDDRLNEAEDIEPKESKGFLSGITSMFGKKKVS